MRKNHIAAVFLKTRSKSFCRIDLLCVLVCICKRERVFAWSNPQVEFQPAVWSAVPTSLEHTETGAQPEGFTLTSRESGLAPLLIKSSAVPMMRLGNMLTHRYFCVFSVIRDNDSCRGEFGRSLRRGLNQKSGCFGSVCIFLGLLIILQDGLIHRSAAMWALEAQPLKNFVYNLQTECNQKHIAYLGFDVDS